MAKFKHYEQTRKMKSKDNVGWKMEIAPKWYCRMFKKISKAKENKFIKDTLLNGESEINLDYQHRHHANWRWR